MTLIHSMLPSFQDVTEMDLDEEEEFVSNSKEKKKRRRNKKKRQLPKEQTEDGKQNKTADRTNLNTANKSDWFTPSVCGGTGFSSVPLNDVSIEDAKVEAGTFENMEGWSFVSLPDALIQGLGAQGFHEPTEIQALTLPPAILGKLCHIGNLSSHYRGSLISSSKDMHFSMKWLQYIQYRLSSLNEYNLKLVIL